MDTNRAPLRKGLAASALLLITVLAGCSAGGDGVTEPTSTPTDSASAAPTPEPSSSVEPLYLPVPDEAEEGELARLVHVAEGPEGVPTTTSFLYGSVTEGQTLRLQGQCTGGEAEYAVTTAAVGDSGTPILSGTIDCGIPDTTTFPVSYTGPISLAFVNMDDAEDGWLRLFSE